MSEVHYMTDLRQEAIRELEKLPEEYISIVLTIMKTMNELNDYKKNESIKENISDIETINAMKELENNGGESFDTLDEFWNSLEN